MLVLALSLRLRQHPKLRLTVTVPGVPLTAVQVTVTRLQRQWKAPFKAVSAAAKALAPGATNPRPGLANGVAGLRCTKSHSRHRQ